jgi:hypothetical protein
VPGNALGCATGEWEVRGDASIETRFDRRSQAAAAPPGKVSDSLIN